MYLKKLEVSDKKKIIKEHILFFNRLLDPDDLGWAVTEEVRNEARLFLGIPQVIIKKKWKRIWELIILKLITTISLPKNISARRYFKEIEDFYDDEIVDLKMIRNLMDNQVYPFYFDTIKKVEFVKHLNISKEDEDEVYDKVFDEIMKRANEEDLIIEIKNENIIVLKAK